MNTRFSKLLLSTVLIVVLALPALAIASLAGAQDAGTYWPTAGWRTSTPEEQGLDSSSILAALDQIDAMGFSFHSFVVIRHGYVVAEVYYPPYTADTPHQIMSITKSFLSAVVGIAIDQGYLKGVDQSIWDFFPKGASANMDAHKEAITLEHLLTMTSGLHYGCWDIDPVSTRALITEGDKVQFELDRPMVADPGQVFCYNSASSLLLSAIIQEITGMTAADFAEKTLFRPLGITDWYWQSYADGMSIGGFGLNIAPRDMAKLGYLYLHDGMWEDQQIVPADWVARSVQKEYVPGSYYGYHGWWPVPPIYMSIGMAGQMVFVDPPQDLMIIFTSRIPPAEADSGPLTFGLEQTVLAKASSEPLPPNTDAQAALQDRIDAIMSPDPELVPSLPEMASIVSGTTYALPLAGKGWGWETAVLAFEAAADTATITVNGLPLSIGLDGLWRVNDTDLLMYAYDFSGGGALFFPDVHNKQWALRGGWQDDKTFAFDMELVGYPDSWTITLAFGDEGVTITSFDRISKAVTTYSGKPM